MKLFEIKKGTPIVAISGEDFSNWSDAKRLKTWTNRDVTFELEDMVIDQISPRCMPSSALAQSFREQGYYGFALGENTRGFHTLVVHGKYMEVL